jgi:hypothetical protein
MYNSCILRKKYTTRVLICDETSNIYALNNIENIINNIKVINKLSRDKLLTLSQNNSLIIMNYTNINYYLHYDNFKIILFITNLFYALFNFIDKNVFGDHIPNFPKLGMIDKILPVLKDCHNTLLNYKFPHDEISDTSIANIIEKIEEYILVMPALKNKTYF